MAKYPALEIHAVDPDLVLAIVDDCSPTAVEEQQDGVRVFFAHPNDRDRAAAVVAAARPAARIVKLEVDDEDWARRSQADLQPVVVGRITVVPGQNLPATTNLESRIPNPITIVIEPSMGFGTGHHTSTRLCLAALQTFELTGRSVLDVGTGSGILAIAADRLGAAEALGIDHDAFAIASARDNLRLNPEARHTRFEEADLRQTALAPVDVLCANLTGALLVASAPLLKRAIKAGGALIVSGLLEGEEREVRDALAPGTVTWRGAEQEWVALAFRM